MSVLGRHFLQCQGAALSQVRPWGEVVVESKSTLSGRIVTALRRRPVEALNSPWASIQHLRCEPTTA
ncbi:hypothetical protein EVAR_23577_1 [Eumeta japonica]|uniref:Uncharacterized protein n=1 Tax=Eumeta variegata TaxID=151549 RepID=A0A4C1WXE6_EUMVA|nr:hypothetical protein EVAR_23577_1 [Eumeta japonica]